MIKVKSSQKSITPPVSEVYNKEGEEEKEEEEEENEEEPPQRQRFGQGQGQGVSQNTRLPGYL
jgi:hypothetical protein